MVKLKVPLLSLAASGSVSQVLTFLKRKGQHLVEKKPVLVDSKSQAQLSWRTMFNLCVDLWHTLSTAEKAEWESAARPRHMTGYAWYLSQCLRPNPGIYLPLAGGTMSGVIQMDGNEVHGLPPPVHVNDAARKAYVDHFFPVDTQGRIEIAPFAYSAIGQGVWALIIDANQYKNGAWWNPSQANLDNISYAIYLDKGTYTLGILGWKGSGAGIMDIDIDGTEVTSFDLYAAPAVVYNQWSSQAGIIIANAGRYTLKLRVDGKNPLSSSFGINASWISLWRTA